MGATAADRAPEADSQVRARRRLLDSLPTRARTTGADAVARSRLVRRLRIALPVLAVVLVAAFIFNTRGNNVDQAFLDDFEDLSASAEELRVASPRFTGVDNAGKPFEITARSAKQRPDGADMVELERPRAVQGGGDEQTIVTALKGTYQSEKNILELEESVELEHKIGAQTFMLRAPEATVAIKDEVVTSSSGVGGEASDGSRLSADRMTAYRGEGRVVFSGDVSMRFLPDSTIAAPASETNSENDIQTQTPEQQ